MFIIYEGPSLIDGMPIVVIVTDDSENDKTGKMLQTWIMRRDIDPISASRTGADVSICGNCIHRGKPSSKATGWATERSCYVNLLYGPNGIFKAYHRGSYRRPADLATIGRDRMVRIGTYGDGAAVPKHIWDALCRDAAGWTAYTHQGNSDPNRYMTSADTLPAAQNAWDRGERTFRVIKSLDEMLVGSEILCPASKEAGKRSTCEKCKLCAGASIAAKSIAIMVHGTGAKHYA